MAVASAKAVVPPPSTFAELLRRSRFSSYDLAIAQTYSAPPAAARRGNYGLKRAIPMPYKDSYISVPTFEHHAHFTDWNNAEQQVKFVKRMEEMNAPAAPLHKSGWYQALGDAQYQWLIDSEFAEVNYPEPTFGTAPPRPLPPPSPPVSEGKMDDLRSYGKQGTPNYGSRRQSAASGAVQLNFEALSPKQFQRYLSQLRKFGPEFREYLKEQYKSRRISQRKAAAKSGQLQEDLEQDLDKPEDFLLFAAAQNPLHKLHRQFLAKHFSKNYSQDASSITTSSKIEAQPHRNGGLNYTHPSTLQSILTSSPLPGIVFQDLSKHNSQFARERLDHKQKRQKSDYLVLFGDVLAKLPEKHTKAFVPVYYPDTPRGVATVDPLESTTDNTTNYNNINGTIPHVPLNFSNSVAKFRFTKCFFTELPKVVSYKNHQKRPSELLNELGIQAEVITDLPWSKRNLDNPHKPGSPQYIAHISTGSRRSFSPNAYGQSTMTGDKSFPYGSQFEASQDMERNRMTRENFRREVYEANERARKKEMNQMGMGMGVKNGYTDEERARMVSTMSGILAQQKVLGDKGQSGEDDDDEGL